MTTYTLSINCPAEIRGIKAGLLSLNEERRLHYMHTGQVMKYWRTVAAQSVRAMGWPQLDRARIVVTVHKTTNRSYDASNLYPVAKAIGDGCTDAGLWLDDNNAHVVGPDIRAGEKSSIAHLTITITELGGPV